MELGNVWVVINVKLHVQAFYGPSPSCTVQCPLPIDCHVMLILSRRLGRWNPIANIWGEMKKEVDISPPSFDDFSHYVPRTLSQSRTCHPRKQLPCFSENRPAASHGIPKFCSTLLCVQEQKWKMYASRTSDSESAPRNDVLACLIGVIWCKCECLCAPMKMWYQHPDRVFDWSRPQYPSDSPDESVFLKILRRGSNLEGPSPLPIACFEYSGLLKLQVIINDCTCITTRPHPEFSLRAPWADQLQQTSLCNYQGT